MKACKNLLLFMFFGFFLYLPACHLNQTGGGDTSGGRATGVKADSDDAHTFGKMAFHRVFGTYKRRKIPFAFKRI